MSLAWMPIVFFVILLAMIPAALKWFQRRVASAKEGSLTSVSIVSAVGVGPHQRVVTVEVGPEGARTWLTLGVTAQHITCLHTAAVPKHGTALPDVAVSALPTSYTQSSEGL
jgi:flagellar protein FliO/FliZ